MHPARLRLQSTRGLGPDSAAFDDREHHAHAEHIVEKFQGRKKVAENPIRSLLQSGPAFGLRKLKPTLYGAQLSEAKGLSWA